MNAKNSDRSYNKFVNSFDANSLKIVVFTITENNQKTRNYMIRLETLFSGNN